MKKLLIMRHAASQPEQVSVNDRDRPLSSLGMQELELMRRKLQGKLGGLGLVLCSNVKRTRQTLDGIKPILPSLCETTFEDGLYQASVEALKNRLRDLEGDQDYVMVIAHNPGISDFLRAIMLYAQPRPNIPQTFPTSGVAIFEGNFKKWQDVSPSRLRLQTFLMPEL
jgi:phosphohistidine phosphatase